MKISYRILLINFVIVVLVLASFTLPFYSIDGKIIIGLTGAALSIVLMLLYLDRKTRLKNEYAGFIALINQNLSLREMSDAALAKIIKSTGLTVGRLFFVGGDGPKLLSSYGLLNETALDGNKIDLYQSVVEKGGEIELNFTENFPVVHSGIADLNIRYLLISPVFFNDKVIAVLELASVNPPRRNVKEYLAIISGQLAIGLNNANSLKQLENLVQELKKNRPEPRTEPAALVELPLKPTEALKPAEAPEAPSDELHKNEIEKRQQHSILIIDPNAENRKIISRYLSSKHYNVLQSAGIAEAAKELSEKRPFAITLSVSSSESVSWDFLMKLKENEQTRGIPVILYNTIESLNFGYGLQVHDYIFNALSANVINQHIERLQSLSGREVKNIICAGFEESALQILKTGFNGNNVRLTSLKEQNAAFKTIEKLQPQLVLVDAFMQKGDSISLLDRLKTSFETRDIPVILCLRPEFSKNELTLLNSSIEKAAIRSKGHRIDILKAIRDRIHLEEGFPDEDTSAILIENSPDDDEPLEGTFLPGADKLPSNKVMIVDDDPDTLLAVGEIVRNSGCQTVLAKNGLECLTALQTLKPDLILLDIMMPQMDGFETIKRIKAEKYLKDIPVFALTAHEMIEEKEILIRNGFDDFISKPVDSGSLSFKIEKVLTNIPELEK